MGDGGLIALDGQARLDTHRLRRRGLPEVVLAEGKSAAEVVELVRRLAEVQGQGLASRLGPEHLAALEAAAGGMRLERYGRAARLLRPGFRPDPLPARVGVITAGTSDSAVAQEVVMMVRACGAETRTVHDVGVAGLHRLFAPLAELLEWEADVLVVAAGMDGVLPGVVCGLVDRPVIGVPVSTGYGRGGRGKGALTTMLQSCATGLLTMNIDNGIGAGAAAVAIARRIGHRIHTFPPASADQPAPALLEAAPREGAPG